jgi:hypothetical protein
VEPYNCSDQESMMLDFRNGSTGDDRATSRTMHTRAGHSSGPNLGTRPRRLFIVVYSAEDAVPLSPNPLPSKHEGMIVRGEKTGRVRSVPFEMKLPQRPQTGSFFNQQVGYDG